MIRFVNIFIDGLESYDKLRGNIREPLMDENVIQTLRENLELRCNRIIIEYPYYDTDYLSTFYIHYAQKLRTYEKMCCRLHILRNNLYYGYIVLRPTITGTKLGRTLLNPQLLISEKAAYLAVCSFDAHIAGNSVSISCFPWKSQETDVSVCAHTATWTILRYFGNKSKNYPDTTIGHIVNMVDNEWGRKTPSIGLNPVQVSDIFKNFGFSPLILQREKGQDDNFDNEVMAYIESGLPMVGFLYPQRHAVSIIGHGKVDTEILDDPVLVKGIVDPATGMVSHAKLVNSLYVMDDNYFPYKRMPVGWANGSSDVNYGTGELKYCVVPLYNRMQLVYNEVYARFKTWMREKVMGWKTPGVLRIYITSANSLKREAMNSDDMNGTLVDLILTLTFPKFVWCIDLADFSEYKEGLTSGRILIDTTAPTLDEEPWILRHDGEKIEYIDIDEVNEAKFHDCFHMIETEIRPYKMYHNNLVTVHTGL